MDIKEKLYSKSSSLRGDKKTEYEAVLDEYFRIKEDLEMIRNPIQTKLISYELSEAHRIIESDASTEDKKKSFIDAIRMYISLILSPKLSETKERIKKTLEEKCLDDKRSDSLYKSVMEVYAYTGGDSNLLIGLIRSY